MVLHTVNKIAVLERCLALTSEQDSVLLIEDGVYAVLKHNSGLWESSDKKLSLYALESDLAARGISDKMPSFFQAVSWEKFVELTLEHHKVVSWG